MSFSFVFGRDLGTGECGSKLEAINVDTKSGYNYAYNHVYFEDGVRKRDVLRMYGIRWLAFASNKEQQLFRPRRDNSQGNIYIYICIE